MLIAAATLILALIAASLYLRSPTSAKLTEKDTIVLADFTNTTEGSVAQGDETLRYLSERLLYRFRCRRHFLFQNNFACFIQNTIERVLHRRISSAGLAVNATGRKSASSGCSH
jgi:hypothetical protein